MLEEPYPYPFNVNLYPFQVRGFNFIKDLNCSIVNWSTGTGKMTISVALINYLLNEQKIDQVFVFSKNHNKTNWQRELEEKANLDSVIADVTGDAQTQRTKRTEIYSNNKIIILNYEKLRLDGKVLAGLLRRQRVLFVWDEGSFMLKNRSTQIYRNARTVKGACKKAYQVVLSATPLENNPEDVYSVVKLLDPSVFPNIEDFRSYYGRTRNPFAIWQVKDWDTKKLHEMGAKIAPFTHRVDKYKDPEIRKQFPQEQWENVIINMSHEDRILYDSVTDQIKQSFWDKDDVLSKMLVLQLICDNPYLINLSEGELAQEIAQKKPPTDKYSAKLQVLHDLLDQIEGKVVLFNMYNKLGSQVLFDYMNLWGFPAVLYDGTAKQRQVAQDSFKGDPDVKVFVSSDAGSDSINLQEATTCINYNQPWKWTTLVQRVNRINRITSQAQYVDYYNLLTCSSIEERKLQVILRKKNLENAIFEEINEDMEGLTKKDLYWILTGENS